MLCPVILLIIYQKLYLKPWKVYAEFQPMCRIVGGVISFGYLSLSNGSMDNRLERKVTLPNHMNLKEKK